MRKLFFLPVLLFSIAGWTQSIDPVGTDGICPIPNYTDLSIGIATAGVMRFEIDFGSSAASGYTIEVNPGSSNKPVSCRVIGNINPLSNGSTKGSCYIAFEDQRAVVPSFSVVTVPGGSVVKKFSFPYIKSLKTGIKPVISGPPGGFSPALCVTGNVPYTFNMVKYRKIDDNGDFGNFITTYEYSVPAGWQVGGVVSTGPNNYIAAGPAATITYDQLHGGDVKIRVKQPPSDCFPNVNGLASGEWSSFTVSRAALSLLVNGGSSLNIRCGEATTNTFTLQNAPSCVNGYQWNIGANNGFIYNGAAAPATISTTSNAIQLTTDCGSAVAVSQVSVSALINGTVVSSFSVPVVVNDPAPTLIKVNGGTALCPQTTMTYVLTNLSCGATVNWTVNQSGLTSGSIGVSPNSNSVTLTNFTPGATGSVSLSYSVTTNCSPKTGSVSITVAPPVPGTPTIMSTMYPDDPYYPYVCPGQVGGWQVAWTPNAWGFNWDYDINLFDYIGGGPPGGNLMLKPKTGYTVGVVYAQATSPCGSSDWAHFVVPAPPSWYCAGIGYRRATDERYRPDSAAYTLSPNPARDHLTITVKNNVMTADAKTGPGNFITEVRIYDLLGRVRKLQRFNKVTSAYITLTDLQTGVYFVEIASGAGKARKNLFITK